MSAQTAITDITYGSLTDNPNQTTGGITYLNRDRTVSTVSTASGDYRFDGPLASNVYIRRNTDSNANGTPNQSGDNPNNTTIIYQVDGSNRNYGDYNASLEQMFLDSNLYVGVRNPFGNGAGTSTNSNIERIDFYFSGGYTVQANDALVFFDVENTGNFGDGFRIAAFTGVGTVNGFSNAPTTYANTGLLVAPDSFGGPIDNPQLGSTGNYRRATFTNADSLAGTATNIASAGNLQLVGILISFADLGISAGTTIYGYSLMAGDTAPTAAADLVNWNNVTYYPTNTDPAGYGNMDFMGFGAQISRPVPEPSTYGALMLSLTGLLVGWRRRRRGLSARAA
ncbi:MAG: PEP-CTERM sorting domain-containing protein [Verrucomicrobiota bacterium]